MRRETDEAVTRLRHHVQHAITTDVIDVKESDEQDLTALEILVSH